MSHARSLTARAMPAGLPLFAGLLFGLVLALAPTRVLGADVAPTEDPTVSRMTIVTSGSEAIIEQITKHLNKLVDVIKVMDLNDGDHIERELMLVKVQAQDHHREELMRLSDIFRGRIIDVTDNSYTVEITGSANKLDAFLKAVKPELILETVRTGISGIARGDRAITI